MADTGGVIYELSRRLRGLAVASYGVAAVGYFLFFLAELNSAESGGGLVEALANALANTVLCAAIWLFVTYFPVRTAPKLRLAVDLVAVAEVLLGVGMFALSSIDAETSLGTALIIIGIGNLLFAAVIAYSVRKLSDGQGEATATTQPSATDR